MGETTPSPVCAAWSPWRHLRERYPDVEVFELELPAGMMGCVDLEQRRIWVAQGLTQAERRCTVAHEIGHLRRGRTCVGGRDKGEERAVDEWAARKLIPIGDLVRAFQWSTHINEVAEELWVDKHMLRARLRGLTDDEQDQLMAAIRRSRGGP